MATKVERFPKKISRRAKVGAAHGGPQSFDLIREIEDQLDAAQVDAEIRAQVFDAPQCLDRHAIKVNAVPFRLFDRRDETLLAIPQNFPLWQAVPVRPARKQDSRRIQKVREPKRGYFLKRS
jgi:hypothetical protein